MVRGLSIEEGIIRDLTFNPTRDFAKDGVTLFGIMVRQQGRRIIIIMKIYEDSRLQEILGTAKTVSDMMMTLAKYQGIESIHTVDSKDVIAQLTKHKIDPSKFGEDLDKEQDITIEATDLITGEYVPIHFGVGLKLDKIHK